MLKAAAGCRWLKLTELQMATAATHQATSPGPALGPLPLCLAAYISPHSYKSHGKVSLQHSTHIEASVAGTHSHM